MKTGESSENVPKIIDIGPYFLKLFENISEVRFLKIQSFI